VTKPKKLPPGTPKKCEFCSRYVSHSPDCSTIVREQLRMRQIEKEFYERFPKP
jgi:hypothetical protein